MKKSKISQKPKRENLIKVFRDLMKASGSAVKHYWLIIFMYMLSTVFSILVAKTLGQITSQAISKQTELLFRSLVFLIVYYLAEASALFAGEYVKFVILLRVAYAFRKKTAESIANAEYTWIAKQKIGDMMSRLQNDIDEALLFITYNVPNFLFEVIRLVLMGGYLFFIQWQLATVFFLTLPFIGFLQIKLSRYLEDVDKPAREAEGSASATAQDLITNRTLIKAYSLNKTVFGFYINKLNHAFKLRMSSNIVEAVLCNLSSVLPIIPLVLLCIAGSELVDKGNLSVSNFLSFFILAQPISGFLSYMGGFLAYLRYCASTVSRIFPIWNAPQENSMSSLVDNDVQYNDNVAAICFEDVSFNYGEGDVSEDDSEKGRATLNHFNLTIKKGEKVGLVGASGCGKSTVIKLISGLYRSTSGKISCFGKPFEEWDLHKLRNNFSFVMQDSFLLPDTIEKNILFGISEDMVSGDKMKEVLINSALYEFIKTLPEGLKTKVGERGVKLSGGEKQRVAIARAFLHNAPILVFDEATSALDYRSEKEVTQAMEKLIADKSALVVAHRLSAVKNMDRIIVMDEGKIVEEGTHESLLSYNSLYHKLYSAESGAAI